MPQRLLHGRLRECTLKAMSGQPAMSPTSRLERTDRDLLTHTGSRFRFRAHERMMDNAG
jgi:hypothetical protein